MSFDGFAEFNDLYRKIGSELPKFGFSHVYTAFREIIISYPLLKLK